MSTSDENGMVPLTRKQLREIRLTGSTPIISEEEAAAAATPPAAVPPRAAEPAELAPAPVGERAGTSAPLTRRQIRALELAAAAAAAPAAEPAPVPAPVPASVPESVAAAEPEAVEPAAEPEPEHHAPEPVSQHWEPDPAPSEPEPATPAPVATERPMVGAAFGLGVHARHGDPIAGAQFDDLLDGTASNSQHGTSTALIFTPSPGVGSLSGPIASTGELLITGTYALPEGLGSQGHVLGAADGRAADAGFMDSELAPSSSPTPIAASSAVSTSRPAGEVIRPPAPDKGNKLMITLAIVAGGLAIVLAATLVIAFTTGVFG